MVEARREALLDIIEAGRPMTVRQVFYQATVRGRPVCEVCGEAPIKCKPTGELRER
jgi:hypothetical protein